VRSAVTYLLLVLEYYPLSEKSTWILTFIELSNKQAGFTMRLYFNKCFNYLILPSISSSPPNVGLVSFFLINSLVWSCSIYVEFSENLKKKNAYGNFPISVD